MEIKAVRATEDNIQKYGKLTPMMDLEEFSGAGWRCWITEVFCMDQPANIGMGFAKQGAPYTVDSMKRHSGTKKLFAPGQGPVSVALAPGGQGAARPQDVEAFILEPGDFLVIDEGVWYDACHGLEGPASYFFASLETDDPTDYVPLAGGAVEVVV